MQENNGILSSAILNRAIIAERYASANHSVEHRARGISGEGVALNLQDFAKLLRSRWVTLCVTILIAVLGALAVTLLTPPLYQASTRLYVSAQAAHR